MASLQNLTGFALAWAVISSVCSVCRSLEIGLCFADHLSVVSEAPDLLKWQRPEAFVEFAVAARAIRDVNDRDCSVLGYNDCGEVFSLPGKPACLPLRRASSLLAPVPHRRLANRPAPVQPAAWSFRRRSGSGS